jgi:hypothetical protein
LGGLSASFYRTLWLNGGSAAARLGFSVSLGADSKSGAAALSLRKTSANKSFSVANIGAKFLTGKQ